MHSLKFSITLIFGVLISTASLQAEVLRWPQVCANGELSISNTTSDEIKTWLQTFTPELSDETEIIIAPHSYQTISLQQFDQQTRFSLLHFYENNSIKAVLHCGQKKHPSHSLEGGLLTFKKSDLKENKLWIQNLFSGENSFQVEFLNKKMKVLSTQILTLGALQQLSFKQSVRTSDWVYIRISAENRFASFNLNSRGSDGPIETLPQKSLLEAGGSYFLIGPRDRVSESFIVRITNPEMIRRARELVANPTIEKMLFAKIEKGHQGFNRNWSKNDKSFWSWSATEVTNFADLGSTACNGAPQIVEDRLENWLLAPARICFWNYRVKKELTSNEVAGYN